MNRKQWLAIDNARKILGLGERATKAEIKKAYHRLCKANHPDTASNRQEDNPQVIYRLTGAYELLMRYCDEYRFPLKPEDRDIYDAEDWWMERFGQDPLWGRRRNR